MNKITALMTCGMLILTLHNAYSADKVIQKTKGDQSPAVNVAPGGTANFNYKSKGAGEKHIIAKILPIEKYSREDLVKLARKLGIEPFDLSLDDTILKDYYLIRLRFYNAYSAINQPLKFTISTGTSHSKIINIKHRVRRPSNKIVEVLDSIPKANWNWPESGIKASLMWDYPLGDNSCIAGFNVYRSLLPESGYGKVNSELITTSNWVMPEEARSDMTPSYYKVTAVNTLGEESPMPSPIVVQNFTPIAYSSFKKKESIGNKSLSQSDNKSEIYLNKQEYRFANGRVDISFVNGLDSGADIEVYLLCKILPDSELAPTVSLVGSSSVSYKLNGNPHIRSPSVPFQPVKLKEELTPQEVKSYSFPKSIYIVWNKPKSPDFAGVRIFRSPERRLGNLRNHPGEEIYDGPGLTDKIDLILPQQDAFSPHEADDSNINYIEPPPRPKHPLIPPPFTGTLSPPPVLGISVFASTTLESDYIVDIPINKQIAFTYTIYAYDNKGNSGYPIFINASLAAPSESVVNKKPP